MSPLPSEPGKLFKVHTKWCSIILKYFSGSQHFKGIRVTTSKHCFNIYLRNEVISLLWDIFWSSVVCHKIWHTLQDRLFKTMSPVLAVTLPYMYSYAHTHMHMYRYMHAHTHIQECVILCQFLVKILSVLLLWWP